jgi:hypothetical protein
MGYGAGVGWARLVGVDQQVVLGLDTLLAAQNDVVSRAQLLVRGIDDFTMSRRVRTGKWQRAAPGVYALVSTTLTTEQRRIAAALYAGADAQLTGPSALHWYGFRSVPATDRVHVLVPHATRRRSAGVAVVQRTRELDPYPRDAGLYRVTSPARAVVDASRTNSNVDAVRAILAEAVRSGITDLGRIEDEVRRAKRSRTGIANRVLSELVDGIRSAPEARLRDLTLTSTVLPLVLWNPTLATEDGVRLPSPDGYLPDLGIALEVDSREHHMSSEDFQRTLVRGNMLSQYGVLVLHFTPAEILREPARVLRMIEATYAERRTHPVPVAVRIIAPQ